ncbi:unnamed protein product [Medioppia subpectinata]|uniref:Glucose-methanol-choline oxidoreductase N-terminal domain-containing protein n=1 Tax=Medioppia subpectinata TaxID=1979941 RepID=A0A7R9KLN8_9ACAR|nr:unnamed protein product [Medioppia subpectinata]CAG2105772.1 unnamed protein product [Medioppia subpectinata]
MPNVKILCLEVGGSANRITDIPAMDNLVVNSPFNRNYINAPQPGIGAVWKYRVIPEHRGKGIGGTSQINSMVYNRGNRLDYDHWAREYGAVGSDYASVLPYFKRWENNTDKDIVAANQGFHGTQGLVQVSIWTEPDPIIKIYHETIQGMGHRVTDINGPVQVGTAIVQAFITGTGRRFSVSNAYIDPNKHTNNLVVLADVLVVRVLFTGRTATGFEYIRKGVRHVVSARREVIVSAGAINTPQLLMQSGVGPARHLLELSIPVKQYLQNHVQTDIYGFIKDDRLSKCSRQLDASALTTDNQYQYFTNPGKDWPNISVEPRLRLAPTEASQMAQTYERVAEWADYYRNYTGRHYLQMMLMLQRVRSRGSLYLSSADLYDYPVYSSQLLTERRDFDNFVDVVSWALYLADCWRLAQYIEPVQPVPGCHQCPKANTCTSVTII